MCVCTSFFFFFVPLQSTSCIYANTHAYTQIISLSLSLSLSLSHTHIRAAIAPACCVAAARSRCRRCSWTSLWMKCTTHRSPLKKSFRCSGCASSRSCSACRRRRCIPWTARALAGAATQDLLGPENLLLHLLLLLLQSLKATVAWTRAFWLHRQQHPRRRAELRRGQPPCHRRAVPQAALLTVVEACKQR